MHKQIYGKRKHCNVIGIICCDIVPVLSLYIECAWYREHVYVVALITEGLTNCEKTLNIFEVYNKN